MNTSSKTVTTREAGHVNELAAGDQQTQRRGHRAKIGADIDGVGDDEQANQHIEQRRGIMTAHVSGQAAPGHPPDFSADHLDRAHQRIGQQKRPSQAVAKLRARLGVGGDSAGIVVGSAGDQARAQNIPKLRPVCFTWAAGRGDRGAMSPKAIRSPPRFRQNRAQELIFRLDGDLLPAERGNACTSNRDNSPMFRSLVQAGRGRGGTSGGADGEMSLGPGEGTMSGPGSGSPGERPAAGISCGAGGRITSGAGREWVHWVGASAWFLASRTEMPRGSHLFLRRKAPQ